MFGNNAPKGAGIGRANRFALIQDGCAAVEERGINNIRMTHNPTHVRRGPVHLAGFDIVYIFHAPLEGDQVSAIVAHDTFWHTGRAGCLQNIEGIGGRDGYAVNRFGCCHQFRPI